MYKLILKYTDDYIYIKTKHKIIEEKLKNNIIQNTKITDIEKFIEEINEIIKKHKLNTLLIKIEIIVIVPSFYNKTDIFLIDYAFKILNYYNYKIKKESEIYEPLLENNNVVLSLWNKDGEISYKEKGKIISEYYKLNNKINKNVEKLIVINNTIHHKITKKNAIYLEPNKYYIINKIK